MDLLKAMRVFVKVVELGGFGRAARALDMAPPVVTRTVADLEAHLGVRLLNRTTRTVALSEVGEPYLHKVRAILLDVDESEAVARESTLPPQGPVRLACPACVAVHPLAHALPRLAALHPLLTLEVACPSPAGGDACDLDIRVSRQPPEGDWVVHRLARTDVVLCAAPAYLQRCGRPQRPADLAGHTWLTAPLPDTLPRCGLVLHGPGGAKGQGESVEVLPDLPLALASTHTELLRAAALAGLGVAVLPSYMLDTALHTQTLERVLPAWRVDRYTLWAATPARRHVAARTRAVLDLLRQAWGGEDCDPWLAATDTADAEQPESPAVPQAGQPPRT
jgi:DNA-binding transcriptional LysR family regulator